MDALLRRRVSRRRFLGTCASSVYLAQLELRAQDRPARGLRKPPDPRLHTQLARIGAHLRARFRDLPSHFIFDYYPWYGLEPYRHWNEDGRRAPEDLATNYLPALGPYDSRSARVLEQHARWIKEAGIGAINVSWWGRGTYEDAAVPLLMDVMRAFDIKVTFHLEPYDGRETRLADDIKYLLREYGERRRWDTFLLLQRADGSAAPVMKLFASILPQTSTNCLGVTRPVGGYVPDAVWRQHTTTLKRDLAGEFERFTLIADSLDVGRVRAGGFDGGTSADPYLPPERWPDIAQWFDSEGLLFTFGVNAGFDVVLPPVRPSDPCYREPRVDPSGIRDWSSAEARAEAHASCEDRIRESFVQTLKLQTRRTSANERQGAFVVFVNSFNEWHEGTQFEPMVPYRSMSTAQRARYHNPENGRYRLDTLGELMTYMTG